MSTLSFWSLSNDTILNVLARVPRRYQRTVSLASKRLRSHLCSSEFHMTRSLLGKDQDRFYVQFKNGNLEEDLWFTFIESRRCLVSIRFPSLPYSVALTVGSDIYFVGGATRDLWIVDTQSGKLRKGPRLLEASQHPAGGLVNDKIYIFGGMREDIIQAQVFDLKTQTWQVAPNPSVESECLVGSVVTPSLDGKIYAINCSYVGDAPVLVYDTRDGKCEEIIPAEPHDFPPVMCVIDNVLFRYYYRVGLMWYDSKDKEWRFVHGLKLTGSFENAAMAECNGKLAFLWQANNEREIWCAMITLHGSSKVGIRAQVQWCDCILSDVPFGYELFHLIVCTD